MFWFSFRWKTQYIQVPDVKDVSERTYLIRLMDSSDTSDSGDLVYRLQRHSSLKDVTENMVDASANEQSKNYISQNEEGNKIDDCELNSYHEEEDSRELPVQDNPKTNLRIKRMSLPTFDTISPLPRIISPSDCYSTCYKGSIESRHGPSSTGQWCDRTQWRRNTVIAPQIKQQNTQIRALRKRMSLPLFDACASPLPIIQSMAYDKNLSSGNKGSTACRPDQSNNTLGERASRRRSSAIATQVKQPLAKMPTLRKRMSLPTFGNTYSPLPSIDSTMTNNNIPKGDQTLTDLKMLDLAETPKSDTVNEKLPLRRYTLITAPAQLHPALKPTPLRKRMSLPTLNTQHSIDSSTLALGVLGLEDTPLVSHQTDFNETYIPIQCYCLRCQIMMRLAKSGDEQLDMWGKYPCFRR